MATKPLSAEVMQAAIDAVAKYGSVRGAARALGIPTPTLQHRYSVATMKQGLPATPPKPVQTDTVTVSGDTCEIGKLSTERIRTLADLIRVCEIDTAEWEIDRWICNKWEMGAKDAAEQPVTLPMFQVKAWLVRKRKIVDARAEIDDLLADAKKRAPARPKLLKPRATSGLMFEMNIPDLHIGKLAWSEETGENYDAKIAVSLFQDAVMTLLHRVRGHAFDQILIPLGNDILHSDSKAGTTTGGTPLDMDSRYQKNFREARKAVTWAIETCRAVAPVKVIMVSGNHDSLGVWHLGDSLDAYFHNAEDVEIDNSPTHRKYHQHGAVMLMFCHGDKGKRQDYPLLMATEQPQMFGRTRYREAHTGHLHQLRVQEHHGVRVRILSSLSGADAWHAENGFVGNQRAAEGFVWSADDGLIATAYYTVPQTEGAA